jgi:8-oxo-dGTP diphosphatase
MWLLTTVGFYSVVRKPGDTVLTIRARVRSDLEALGAEYLPTLGVIESGGGTDYPYRARVHSRDLASALTRIVEDIDDANFKDSVATRQGLERAHVYGDVWSALRELTPKGSNVPDLPFSYGGVVIDSAGRVLLREPSRHYGGYVWTFPKGHSTTGETDRQTALRETEEETGVVAEIVAPIPGMFSGDTTRNIYFLMRPTGEVHEPGEETSSVRWATPNEAREMIMETPDVRRRRRVLEVLEAALKSLDQLDLGG